MEIRRKCFSENIHWTKSNICTVTVNKYSIIEFRINLNAYSFIYNYIYAILKKNYHTRQIYTKRNTNTNQMNKQWSSCVIFITTTLSTAHYNFWTVIIYQLFLAHKFFSTIAKNVKQHFTRISTQKKLSPTNIDHTTEPIEIQQFYIPHRPTTHPPHLVHIIKQTTTNCQPLTSNARIRHFIFPTPDNWDSPTGTSKASNVVSHVLRHVNNPRQSCTSETRMTKPTSDSWRRLHRTDDVH